MIRIPFIPFISWIPGWFIVPVTLLFAVTAAGAPTQNSPAKRGVSAQSNGAVTRPRQQAVPTRKGDSAGEGRREPPSSSTISSPLMSSRRSTLGVGLALGSNAVFGNALTVHLQPLPFVEARAGVGYNTTGGKFGAGGSFVLPIGPVGLMAGGAVVRSTGNKDKVSVPAKFTPEGSSSAEEINAIRKYKVSAADIYSLYGAGYLTFASALRLELAVNWNKVISGNKVDFEGGIEYDKPVEPMNEDEVQPRFEAKARDKLDSNGIGFSVGLQLRL